MFSNKVDIWALGCIFHELLSGWRAFNDDWNVQEYAAKTSRLKLSPFSVPLLQSHLSAILEELLSCEPAQRPRASDIHILFLSYRRLLDPAITQHVDHIRFVPSYGEWKQLARKHAKEHDFCFYCPISRFYCRTHEKKAALEIWQEIVQLQLHFESPAELLFYLAEAHAVKGDFDASITVLEQLKHRRISHRLETLRYLGRISEVIGVSDAVLGFWVKVAELFPLWSPGPNWLKIADRWNDLDSDSALLAWGAALSVFPDDSYLKTQVRIFCESPEDIDSIIIAWKGLLHATPKCEWLQERLAGAYDRKGDEMVAIAGWYELVLDNLDVMKLRERLMDACNWKNDSVAELSVWQTLHEKKTRKRISILVEGDADQKKNNSQRLRLLESITSTNFSSR